MLAVKVVAPETGRVTLHNLVLPHGSYRVRVLVAATSGGTGAKGGGGGGKKPMVLMERYFCLCGKRRQRVSRIRRHIAPDTLPADENHRPNSGGETLPTMDLILENLGSERRVEEQVEAGDTKGYFTPYSNSEEGGTGLCLCCKCFEFYLAYEETTAVLSFSYQLNATCDAACSLVNLQLYRERHIHSKAQCTSDKQDLETAQRIGQDKNVTEGPITYSNVDTGCYYFVLKPLLYRLPERSYSLWAKPAINVTDMEKWDPFIVLDPNPERRSLTVRWTVSEVYNFSSYHLNLQYHPTIPINCTGETIYPNMSNIPQGGLTIYEPMHAFDNLSSGWYCARVTPLDDRCPLDGCQVVSSAPRQLKEPMLWKCEDGGGGEGCEKKDVKSLTLLVTGCVLGAVVTGVVVACGILRIWPSITQVFTSATQYSPVPIRPAAKTTGGRKPIVLLVWTPQGPHGAKFGPIIAAFKTILRTYSHCEVYDYLDLSSLPERQQLHLLASPTTWLDSILAQRSVKVIIVATEGAWQRQMEWRQPMPTPQKDSQNHLSTPHQAHDQLLFPYLLRRLHNQPDLAGDYSRVFHIRFSDVTHSTMELENIVSWKLHKIPEHLRLLTVSLHGGVGGGNFEEPTEDQLKELREALTSHPQHCGHTNGTGPPWPSLVTSNGLAPAALSNGTTKT